MNGFYDQLEEELWAEECRRHIFDSIREEDRVVIGDRVYIGENITRHCKPLPNCSFGFTPAFRAQYAADLIIDFTDSKMTVLKNRYGVDQSNLDIKVIKNRMTEPDLIDAQIDRIEDAIKNTKGPNSPVFVQKYFADKLKSKLARWPISFIIICSTSFTNHFSFF